jgi:O-antigen ligase
MASTSTIKDKLSLLPLLVVAATIAMPVRVNSLATIVSIVISLVIVVVYHKDLRIYKSPFYILLLLQGLILVIGWFHSIDQRQGLSDLERYLYAIALPLIVYASRGALSTTRNVVTAFAIGVGALMIYGWIYIVATRPSELGYIFSNGHSTFTDHIHVHPSYLAIYLIFIFFFLTEYARLNFSRLGPTKKTIVVLLIVVDLAAIIFIRSQIELLVFVLLIVLYGLILYKKRAAMVTFLLFTVGIVVYLSDSKRAHTFLDVYGRNVSSAVDERWNVWGGALMAFQSAPLFGAGTGGEQAKLDQVYLQMEYASGAQRSFNAHNQYLEILVRNGIVEFIVFIALLYFLFREALKKSEYTFLLMLMLFTMSMIAESCLNVQKGIAFFYFFAPVFLFLTPSSGENAPFEPGKIR